MVYAMLFNTSQHQTSNIFGASVTNVCHITCDYMFHHHFNELACSYVHSYTLWTLEHTNFSIEIEKRATLHHWMSNQDAVIDA